MLTYDAPVKEDHVPDTHIVLVRSRRLSHLHRGCASYIGALCLPGESVIEGLPDLAKAPSLQLNRVFKPSNSLF